MSDEKKIAIEATNEKPLAKKSASKPAHADKTTGPAFLSGLLSLLSILAIVSVGVFGYLGFIYFNQVSERIIVLEQQEKNIQSDFQRAASAIGENVSKLQSQYQQMLEEKNTNTEKKLTDIAEQLSATRRQIQAVGGRHQSDWMLAEADYLVRIATNRLLLEGDHLTALVLLVSADERIMLMDDPGLQSVREALSRDMATLRLVKRADIAGLAIRISSLIPQLKALPVLAFQLPEETIEEIAHEKSNLDTGWQQSLKNTFKELSVKWFEVKNHSKPVTPLMAPETEAILLTNVTLLLQTAQFAILRQHSDLYHHSMQQLKDWINEYFDTSDAVVIAFLNEVDLLNATEVRAELPKTLESRLILAREMEQRLQQLLAPTAKEESVSSQK